MTIWKDIKTLRSIQTDLKDLEEIQERPGRVSSVGSFLSYYGYSFRLMSKEKELLLFILMQWLSIAIGYYLFMMMLYWIPEEVWRSTETSDEGSIADLVLFLWMIICIGIAALPLSIASSCMTVVHFLHSEGKQSTIAACLKIVLPNTWALWLFHWLDGYITVGRIIERLPKKNDRTPAAQKIVEEALYYAWKVATMGILPNLIVGRSIKDTAISSVQMIKEHTTELLIIRTGYSILCWIVAIATYILGVMNYGWISEKFLPGDHYENIAEFYFIAGIPVLISVAVIQLFIRPAYILALSDVFVRHNAAKGQKLLEDTPPSPATSAFVTFAFFILIIFIGYLYRYDLGIMDMLATPYGEEYGS